MTATVRTGEYGREIGHLNRMRVLEALRKYPGITNRELATLLAMNVGTVGGHVRVIRLMWADDYERRTASGYPR